MKVLERTLITTLLTLLVTVIGTAMLWNNIVYVFTTPQGQLTALDTVPVAVFCGILAGVWFAVAFGWYCRIDDWLADRKRRKLHG